MHANELLAADATMYGIAIAVAVLLIILVVALRRPPKDRVEDRREPTKALDEAKKAPEAAEPAKADAEGPPDESDDELPEELREDDEDDEDEDDEAEKSLAEGLGKTRKEGFIARLGSLFSSKKIDDDLLDSIEEVLFTADIGVKTADLLMTAVREGLDKKQIKDTKKVWGLLRDEARGLLQGAEGTGAKPAPEGGPQVIMVLGVNGTGKTTSIGKLAHRFIGQGKKVMLIAGDTFRAAAAEQLEHWGRRVGAETFRGKEGADPASVVFDGLEEANAQGDVDIVLVDTAGRLHTQKNLMEELKKVRRVMGRAVDDAPHQVLMVLDATTGQNAIQQATTFGEATEVTGIILTKLDGTAKGGVVLGICAELGIPIEWVGIGERVKDLRTFDAAEFVDALFPA